VNASSPATTSIVVPIGLAPGTYFLSAIVDQPGAVVEADEGNNGLTAVTTVTILMHRADLTLGALTAPASVRTGQTLLASNTVRNIGPAASPASRVTFYMSATDATPGAGIAVGVRNVGALGAGASSPATTALVIPLGLAPGVYFLSAVADSAGVVTEVDEANNGLTAAAVVEVVLHRPDLTLITLSVPATGHVTRPLAIAHTIKNVGQAASPAFRVTFFMSATDATPGAGIVIGVRNVGGLGVGASAPATISLVIPGGVEPGTYHVSAVVDHERAVPEVDDDHNGFTAATQVTVGLYRADLTITALAGPASGVGVAGRALAVTASVKNVGPAPSGAFRADLYLSSDGTLDAADILLARQTFGSLGPNGTLTTTLRPVIPPFVPPAEYVALLVVDAAAAIPELLEDNNRRATAAIGVVPLMVRAYPLLMTLTLSACTNPIFDSSETGPITLRITSQEGTAFRGAIAFSGTTDGIVITTRFAFLGNAAVTAAFHGTFALEVFGNGVRLITGDGTFAGGILGTQLAASAAGAINIVTGDSCQLGVALAPP
jgi:subtilase family serine protease